MARPMHGPSYYDRTGTVLYSRTLINENGGSSGGRSPTKDCPVPPRGSLPTVFRQVRVGSPRRCGCDMGQHRGRGIANFQHRLVLPTPFLGGRGGILDEMAGAA
mmetsp:Transcript_15928/g.34608  ORF Transcript_15928/g.34608 Transcript_15928/m.34608 type:complete len:104 (-) Transcript_15928:499-810(-)